MSKSILVISDMHIPYQHPDMLDFFKAVKRKYKPDRVVCIGDELDYHALSFHDSDPDLDSSGKELEKSLSVLKKVYKIFPEVDVVDSNHGSMVFRKQKAKGIPSFVFKSYREMLEAPKGWRWHHDLTVKLPNGERCYFHHGKTGRVLGLSQSVGMSAVAGHFHEQFSINYWQSPKGMFFQMQVGCLIDNKSLAFAYNKNFTKVPLIGLGMIINGHPRLIPMVLDKRGRWVRHLV